MWRRAGVDLLAAAVWSFETGYIQLMGVIVKSNEIPEYVCSLIRQVSSSFLEKRHFHMLTGLSGRANA